MFGTTNCKCPKCGSTNVKNIGKIEKSFFHTFLDLSTIASTKPKNKYTYECQKCKHIWIEEK